MWQSLKFLIAASAVFAATGCQTIGPKIVGVTRERYNNAVQSTAKQQTLSNIVRAFQHEPIQYLDVQEINASATAKGSFNPTIGGIGSGAGAVGTTAGSIDYSENPSVRYLPLSSNALVQQLVTPVSVDALSLLFDSWWDIGTLLDLSTSYITLDENQRDVALNTIIELNDRQVLQVTASKAQNSAPPEAGAKPSNDALVLYLLSLQKDAKGSDLTKKKRELQLWIRLLRIYGNTQVEPTSPKVCTPVPPKPAKTCKRASSSARPKCSRMSPVDLQNWDVHIDNFIRGTEADQNTIIDRTLSCLSHEIQLRILPTLETTTALTGAPLIRTHSALGILRAAAERPNPKIEFVIPAVYADIRQQAWNRTNIANRSFYTLLPEQEDSVDCDRYRLARGECNHPDLMADRWDPQSQEDATDARKARETLQEWIGAWPPKNKPQAKPYPFELFVYEPEGADLLSEPCLTANYELRRLRRYVLVIVGDRLPEEPVYASYFDGGRWYYIARDDIVSQKNFQLIALFMTMMAQPTSTQPLLSVLNVGG